MEKAYLLKLTLALYRVSELLPKKEPLRFLMREKANQILADGLLVFSEKAFHLAKAEQKNLKSQILKNIAVLGGFFEIARAQKWLKEVNFLVLKREYANLEREVKNQGQTGVRPSSDPRLTLTLRGKKILQVLREKKRVQVKDLKEIFPQVSKRTLRRDFEELLDMNLVERLGDGNRTEYRIKLGQVGT